LAHELDFFSSYLRDKFLGINRKVPVKPFIATRTLRPEIVDFIVQNVSVDVMSAMGRLPMKPAGAGVTTNISRIVCG